MKSPFAISRLAITFLAGIAACPASAAGRMTHDAYVAQTRTYRPIEGFDHIVAGKRFTGFFQPMHGGCVVSLIISQADDEALRTPPQRVQFDLGATQVVHIAASPREALGIACTADANAMKVAPLARSDTRTVLRD